MATNTFELQGRVGYIDIKYKDNDKGTVYTTLNIGVKKTEAGGENEDWDNFFVTFFNTAKRNTAELLADKVTKGDYIRVVGKLTENKYKPEGAEQEKSEIQLIGYGFRKQKYDDMKQAWIDIE